MRTGNFTHLNNNNAIKLELFHTPLNLFGKGSC